jgi:hypothetical protein
MCDHGPTHVDAISHLDRPDDAPRIDQMSLDTFATKVLGQLLGNGAQLTSRRARRETIRHPRAR